MLAIPACGFIIDVSGGTNPTHIHTIDTPGAGLEHV